MLPSRIVSLFGVCSSVQFRGNEVDSVETRHSRPQSLLFTASAGFKKRSRSQTCAKKNRNWRSCAIVASVLGGGRKPIKFGTCVTREYVTGRGNQSQIFRLFGNMPAAFATRGSKKQACNKL